MLWDGNEHLVDGHMVKYVTDLGAKRGETGQNKDAILALGNPDLGDERLELYFAQKEAGEIKFLFPEGTDLFKGKEATETAVKDTLSKKRFSIIHLACHGRFNRTIPELSYLMLSGDGKEDGFLYVDEIKALDVSSDLVVLSACESGTGILGEGGEVQALDKAFLSGDVGHVISSLWRISDVATGVLFKYIYRNLYQGMDMDTAYWHAVIELKKRFPEPRYWGAMKFTSSMMQ